MTICIWAKYSPRYFAPPAHSSITQKLPPVARLPLAAAYMHRLLALFLLGRSAASRVLGATQQAPEGVYFGLGSDFYGTDFAVVAWGGVLQLNFEAQCSAVYAMRHGVASIASQSPANCVPVCFRFGFEVQRSPGVMHFLPSHTRCAREAARVRVARFASSASQLSDADEVVFYETYSA